LFTFKLAGLSYTYRITTQGNDESKEGADQFVDTVGTHFISTNLTATDDESLTRAYLMISIVIRDASPEKIASRIPESEIRTFIEHTRDALDTLSTDHNWLRSGTLSISHAPLMNVVTGFVLNKSFLKTFLHSEVWK
jgi:hypothetical protein